MRIQRRVVRHPTRLEVLEVNETSGTGTYILDVSALGIRLETPIPFAQRDLLSIKFLIPGETRELLVGGKVMWIRPLPTPPERFIVGMRLFVPQWHLYRIGRQWQGLKQID